MHGANAPLMRSMVSQQMELEKKVLAGEVRYIWDYGNGQLNTHYSGQLERSVIKLEDAVPLSEKENESQVSKKEDDDNTDKPSEETQDSKQVTWSIKRLFNVDHGELNHNIEFRSHQPKTHTSKSPLIISFLTNKPRILILQGTTIK